jgi:hypothetical protein
MLSFVWDHWLLILLGSTYLSLSALLLFQAMAAIVIVEVFMKWIACWLGAGQSALDQNELHLWRLVWLLPVAPVLALILWLLGKDRGQRFQEALGLLTFKLLY